MTEADTSSAPPVEALRTEIEKIEKESGAKAIAVEMHDAQTGTDLRYNADRWFHAASVMKIAVMAALFEAVERGRFTLDCRLHVRNRFLSIAPL